MGVAPWITILVSLLGPAFWFGGLGDVAGIVVILTFLCALVSLAYPGKETPTSGRIVPFLAVILAATPLIIPEVQAYRLQELAKKRAIETASLYEEVDRLAEGLQEPVRQHYYSAGYLPEYAGMQQLPIVSKDGRIGVPPESQTVIPPLDPFRGGSVMRWAVIRDRGVLLVSAGQDGTTELPLPPPMIDGPPAEPLAALASTGADPRLYTYDPTNGALGLGDVVRWVPVSPDPSDYQETFGPLFEAWDIAEQRSPYRPTPPLRGAERDPDPQGGRDATAAEQLLRERRHLAALALASRAINERDIYPAQWSDPEFVAARTKGIALYHLGAFRAAADVLRDYLDTRPNDALGHYFAAAALQYGQTNGADREAAFLHISAAAMINPSDPIRQNAEARLREMESGRRAQFPPPDIVAFSSN